MALIPLAILVYGTGLQSKVFLVAFAATWPLLIQTIYGARDLDPVATRDRALVRIPRAASGILRVTLMGAVPYIATGVRIASATALILAVTAELIIGSAGLGREINIARQGGAVDIMYALIVTTGLLGWAPELAVRRRRAARAALASVAAGGRGMSRRALLIALEIGRPLALLALLWAWTAGGEQLLLPAARRHPERVHGHVGVRALRRRRRAEPRCGSALGYAIAVRRRRSRLGVAARAAPDAAAHGHRRSSSSCARSPPRR